MITLSSPDFRSKGGHLVTGFITVPAAWRAAPPRRRWRQLSRCLIQRRRLTWLAQIIQILPVEGAERGFDRWAEAGYALPNALAEQRSPNPGLEENFWRTNGRGAAGMKFAV